MLNFISVKNGNNSIFLEMPHRLYYEFSIRSFMKQQNMQDDLLEVRRKKAKDYSEQDMSVLYEHRLAQNDVLVYAALSLEAYINYYAIRHNIPYQKDLEKSLSTLNKFKIYTQLKTKKCLSGELLNKIKSILKNRDEIVHPKPQKIQQGFTSLPKPTSMQGKIELMNLGEIILELNSIYNAVFEIDEDEKKTYEDAPWLLHLERRA